MLNLDKFTKEEITVVPIVRGWGQYKGRKLYSPKTEDGWYLVTFGNNINVGAKATLLEIEKALKPFKKLQVFALGSEGIPMNFDAFKKRGLDEEIEVNFLDLPIFSVAEIVQWEDKRFYYYGQKISKTRKIIEQAKRAFEEGKTLLELQGITPEIRFYFLLCSLQRQSYEAIRSLNESFSQHGEFSSVSKHILRRHIEHFQSTFSGRLEDTIRRAGAKLTSFSKQGNGYLVTWTIDNQTIKSTIKDNMQIISAGFCLNDSDKDHTMGSLVALAQLFQEDKPLYITRE